MTARPRGLLLYGALGLATCLSACVPLPERDLPHPTPREIAYVSADASSGRPDPGRPEDVAPKGEYTIAKGDTLWSIAQRLRLARWTELLEANPGLDPESLRPGTRIVVPRREGQDEPVAAERDPGTRSAFAPAPRVPQGATELDFAWPARGRLLCRFGQSMPGAPYMDCRGILLAVRPGAQVCAAKSGVAFAMESLPGLGRTVAIDHGDGMVTMYAHNSRILVRHGEYVRQGQPVALAGSTGRAQRAQLLFRVDANRRPVDPLRYLPR